MDYVNEIEKEGLAIIPDILSRNEILQLKKELEKSIEEDNELRSEAFDKNMTHNCMTRGEGMAAILDDPTMNFYIKKILSDTCILYAYQSSSLFPNGGSNYAARIHVDTPRHIPGYVTNVGVIFPLNDFTEENGATYAVKGSHESNKMPKEEYFYENAIRTTCKAGDMIVFDARLVHCAGVNNTDHVRHALTLNFCRSYMRQRFDFPRLMSPEQISRLGEDGKRLIGMNVRMPTSLDEFYLPEKDRLYKSNQG